MLPYFAHAFADDYAARVFTLRLIGAMMIIEIFRPSSSAGRYAVLWAISNAIISAIFFDDDDGGGFCGQISDG